MKIKGIYLIAILWLVGNLAGCTRKEEIVEQDEGEEMKIYEFFELEKAPRATGEQVVEDIIKIKLQDLDGMWMKTNIAINIGEKGLFLNPSVSPSSIDIDRFDRRLTEEGITQLLNILREHDVINWSDLYGVEESAYDGDYYIGIERWTLALQFRDGSVKWISGNYNGEEDFPEDLEIFISKLEDFVELAGSKEANIVREDEDEPKWITGMTSYRFEFSNEQIEVRLNGDMEEHGYRLSICEEWQGFAVSKEEIIYTKGWLIPPENFINNTEIIKSNIKATVIEQRWEEYPQYVFYQWELTSGGDRWNYEMRLNEYSSAIALINTISEESAQEIYELLSFEVVTE
ncbi:MAG: hypothetical protein R3Y54_05935 [Eubacteriales bacterium]